MHLHDIEALLHAPLHQFCRTIEGLRTVGWVACCRGMLRLTMLGSVQPEGSKSKKPSCLVSHIELSLPPAL
jgi:hypothetical protein